MKKNESAVEKNPFDRAEVMLAQKAESLPSDMGWVFELKYDGHRTLAFAEGGRVRLLTRNGLDCTKRYPAVAEALEEVLGTRAAVADGEMIAVGEDGLSDFSALQTAVQGGGAALSYVLFDLLALDGRDLRHFPLTRRKSLLERLLQGAPSVLHYSRYTDTMSESDLKKLQRSGAEGVVCKRADSPYTAGRNGDWLKIKFRRSEEFVVGGCTLSATGELKALLLGRYAGGLVYCGSVGTGFSAADRRTLLSALAPLRRSTSPFSALPKGKRSARFAEPVLIAQVAYAGITPAGLLRQASFLGLRTDKAPSEVTDGPSKSRVSSAGKPRSSQKTKNEAPMSEEKTFFGVTITHPEKVMFPEDAITKGELAAYYAAVAPRMLPHIKGRLLSLVCCPDGIGGERFFRRHLAGKFAGVGKMGEGGDAEFFVREAKGILSLVQYNAVEFHVHAGPKGRGPDVMVFDLDPDEGLPLEAVRRGALDVKEVLEELGLVSFLKTSGGKGYHVTVPFGTGADGEKFRAFSQSVARLLEARYPERYTSSMPKKERRGKIFIDWQRNGTGATSAAPYSVRARKGAPVSAPIAWEELFAIAPADLTVACVPGRADPWEHYFEVKASQRLK